MNCDDATRLVDGYLDGELDPLTNQVIEEHLSSCSKCELAYRAQEQFLHRIETGAPYYKASTQLRERVQSSLRLEIPERSPTQVTSDAVGRRSRESSDVSHSWNWLGLAAALLIGALIGAVMTSTLLRPDPSRILASELVSSHARSLISGHLTDVASSDQHTVKPWLDNKLDFAPSVFDLAADGFPLIGGRLDYIVDRPVAAMVYQRRKHFINLFVWPAGKTESPVSGTITRQGYHLIHWMAADLDYWAVSDVSEDDLATLKQAFERQNGSH